VAAAGQPKARASRSAPSELRGVADSRPTTTGLAYLPVRLGVRCTGRGRVGMVLHVCCRGEGLVAMFARETRTGIHDEWVNKRGWGYGRQKLVTGISIRIHGW
jgi:hypothetical protein